MRYRKLDENGDYSFGHGQSDFYKDQVEAVGQAVRTRLWLFYSEWFLDVTEGTRWGGFPISEQAVVQGRILAESTESGRDLEVQQRILNTQGMSRIDEFFSGFDHNSRTYRVNAILTTIYGRAAVTISGSPGGTTGFSLGVSSLGGGGAL